MRKCPPRAVTRWQSAQDGANGCWFPCPTPSRPSTSELRARGTTGRRPVPAFTLLELLAVAAILILLAGLVVGIANYARVRAYNNKARADVAVLETAIEGFHAEADRYPTSSVYRGTIWGYDYLGLFWEMVNSSLLGHQLVEGGYVNKSGLLLRSNWVQSAFPYCDPDWNQGFIKHTNLSHVFLDPWERPYNYYRTYPVITTGYKTQGEYSCTYSYSPYPYDTTNPAYTVTNKWSAWVGGQINTATYDLWSYGVDRKSSGPGWNVGWKAQYDDIGNFTVP